MKTITVRLTSASVGDAIRQLKDYQKWLEEKAQEFLKELGDYGLEVASAKFSNAIYDGTNDVSVHVEEGGDNSVAVVAVGNATLFIEFGSGIIYPDVHPEASQNGMVRGAYGYGFGNSIWGWTYEGEPGTNGVMIQTGRKQGKVHTFGNPANMSMYLTVREIEEAFASIARRVFST